MPANVSNEEALFHAARKIADAAARALFLRQACGEDAARVERVAALLAMHDREPDSAEPAATREYDEVAERAGSKVGPYVLRERIGEGGFGLVFVAEQTEPVKRKVALKVIKPGMDSRQVIARFEAERQALALMDHPNIAKVFDAGATDSGRPYFVMELVRGIPITEYCDKHQLTPKERLELFVTVCQAIQHAHQKGVIHRDVKPSNVLVTNHDGKPVAKVIDFGVAKAIHQNLTERTIYTNFAQMIGTPLYMSPEQAEMSGLDVDTRSDVYSLGVLLYELLTGTTPLEKQRLAKAAYDEVRRMIREEEPPKPSTRLSSTDSIASIAAQRHSEPSKLSKLVRGDLDWITMKALEKDRTRRYETANGLARDIQRYLGDEPVEACPPSASYRLRKFAKKNRPALTTTAAVFVLLIGGVAFSTWQAVRATKAESAARRAQIAEAEQRGVAEENERQARKAAEAERSAKTQTQKRLVQIEKGVELFAGMLAGINPRAEELGGDPLYVQLRKRAEQAADTLDAEAVGDPLAVARLQTILGKTLRGLGNSAKAVELLEKARTIRVRELGADHADNLDTLVQLALAYREVGKLPESIALLEQVRDTHIKKFGTDHPYTLARLSLLAACYQVVGRSSEAIALLEQVSQAQIRKLGADHINTLDSLGSLAMAYQAAGRLPEAIALCEQVRDVHVKKHGVDHYYTLVSLNNLANAYAVAWNYPAAIPLFEQVRDAQVKKLGADHPATLTAMNNVATIYQGVGRLPESIALHEQIREIQVKKLGADHPSTLTTLHNLAQGYRNGGKYPEAIALFKQVLDSQVKKLGADHPSTLSTYTGLAMTYRDAGKFPEAVVLSERARDAHVKKLGADHRETLLSMNFLAIAYRDAGKSPQAIALFEQVRDARIKKLGPDAYDTLITFSGLAKAYQDAGRLPEAIPLFERAATGLTRQRLRHPLQHPQVGAIMDWTSAAYAQAGRFDKAEYWRRQWLPVVKERSGVDSTAFASELEALGMIHLQQKKSTDAEPILREALTIRKKKEPDAWNTFNTHSLLGGALLGQKKYADAEPLLLKGYEGMKAREQTIPPQGKQRLPEALDRLIDFYTATDKPDEVKKRKAERAKYSAAKAAQKK